MCQNVQLFSTFFSFVYIVDMSNFSFISHVGMHNISHVGMHNISHVSMYNISHVGMHNISHVGMYNISHVGMHNMSDITGGNQNNLQKSHTPQNVNTKHGIQHFPTLQ